MLDRLSEQGFATLSVGKIYDIFAGKGIAESMPTTGNADGMEKTMSLVDRDFHGLCFGAA